MASYTSPVDGVTLQRVESPTDDQLLAAVDLFCSLMSHDGALKSLTGDNETLVTPLLMSMLRPVRLVGEYYEAVHETDGLVGFITVMPPGQELLSTEEQRKLGHTDYIKSLSPAAQDWFNNVFTKESPAFLASCFGQTGELDSWFIDMLMVKKEYHGKGIGRSLINIVRQKAAVKGDVVALATTFRINTVKYQRMGFTLHGENTVRSPWGDWSIFALSLDTKST